MINQDKCSEALMFASIKHEGQKMKRPEVGYVTHLQGVCNEAITGCLNAQIDVDYEKIMLLALMHDVIEDTSATYEDVRVRFGEEIADGVLALTKNDELPKEERMPDSVRRIKKQSREVAIVKLADRIFNLRDIPNDWSREKVESYRKEAIFILEELGPSNFYMANRLKQKINDYKFVEIK